MTELKNVLISSDPEKILNQTKLHSFETPFGYTDSEFIQLRSSLLSDIESITKKKLQSKIIMSGHQPNFLHPGILFKDILASKIAKETGATVLHLIVDTDQVGMEFVLPVSDGTHAHLERYLFHKREHNVYKYVKTTEDDRKKLVEIREKISSDNCFLPKDKKSEFLALMDTIIEKSRSTEFFYQLTEIFRNHFIAANAPEIIDIHLSDLTETECFRVFVEKIRERHTEFKNIFNAKLAEYRQKHNISNKAQPIPDLKDNEMPFWILDKEGKRLHMYTDSDNKNIIPRAITLTMFLRLFVSDLFIHGTGGGRYEAVSHETVKDFFKIQGAPWFVASLTMNLLPDKCFQIQFPTKREILDMERNFQFSPELFCEADNELLAQKTELIRKLELAPKGQKREIHLAIMDLNQKIQNALPHIFSDIQKLKKQLPLFTHTKEVFSSRILPYLFYNTQEITNFSKNLQFS